VNRVQLSDAADSRLDDFRDLMSADGGVRGRDVVIAEGVNVVARLLRSGSRPRAVVGVASKLDALATELDELQVPVYELDKWLISDVVGFRVTRGVLASVTRPDPLEPAAVLNAGRRFVVLETINDFENIGAIFRNAAAFGVDGVLLDPRCADPFYRRSVRVSMGHVFGLAWAVLDDPWPQSLGLLRERGIELLGLTPRPCAVSLRQVSVSGSWAVLLGAEGPGLTDAALAACDRLVSIPMAAGVDSLNVATAGAVALAHLAAAD
jgi:tRNA G18 (ribose-2'-O)-methylase SpoU